MAKNLKLKNGAILSFSDISTIYDLAGVYQTSAELDQIRFQLTKENLVVCEFNGETFRGIIPVGMHAESEMSGDITVHFYTRDMTDLEKIQEDQSDMEDAINYILEKIDSEEE